MLIGAEAGADGRIFGLPGVEPKQGYKQTVVQWCSEGAAPPLTVVVSDPIPVLSANGRVCYVISVAESDLTPHFLNGRRGLYVRTDEFSKRFEPQLATEQELRHLMNRRQLILERRAALLQRAEERFGAFVKTQASKDPQAGEAPPAIFRLAIMPRYLTRPVSEHATLLALVEKTRVSWRGTVFPMDRSDIISQQESAIVLRPCQDYSLMEVSIWGMVSYVLYLSEHREDAGTFIHTRRFLGHLLVFLEHARRLIQGARHRRSPACRGAS